LSRKSTFFLFNLIRTFTLFSVIEIGHQPKKSSIWILLWNSFVIHDLTISLVISRLWSNQVKPTIHPLLWPIQLDPDFCSYLPQICAVW
jgi:hypothetical protein